jgi:hypothetical protein
MARTKILLAIDDSKFSDAAIRADSSRCAFHAIHALRLRNCSSSAGVRGLAFFIEAPVADDGLGQPETKRPSKIKPGAPHREIGET